VIAVSPMRRSHQRHHDDTLITDRVGSIEVGVEVHTLVEDANDTDSAGYRQIHDQMVCMMVDADGREELPVVLDTSTAVQRSAILPDPGHPGTDQPAGRPTLGCCEARCRVNRALPGLA